MQRSNKGFTLIELLVVIAIIAILAAILFPVFAQARAKARQTSCLSNLKQLTLSMTMYAQDYDETFPYWNWGSGSKQGGATENYSSLWIDAIYPYVKSAGVYTCPSDVGSLTPISSSVFWWTSQDTTQMTNANASTYLQKLGVNAALVNQKMSYGMSEPLHQGTLFGGDGKSGTALAAMNKPANTLILADNITLLTAGPYGNGNFPDPNNPKDPQHNCIIRRVAYANQNDGTWSGDCATALPAWDSGSRHSAGAEIGFADGHVSFKRNSRVTNDLYRGDDSP